MNLTSITATQASKEVTINDNFEAVAIAALFGVKRALTTALTFAYWGGTMLIDGVQTTIADGTLTLSASTTNYIEATRAGVVSKNTTAFTPGSIPLYTAVTGTASITTLTDVRVLRELQPQGKSMRTMTDANYTLTAAEARPDIWEFIGGALTGTRTITIPSVVKQVTIYNGTSGAQSLLFIGSGSPTGSSVTIANGKRAIIYCDGFNVNRVTADT